MSYNQVNTPKFYLDAVLLARQWGMTENDMNSANFFHLNPSNLTPLVFDTNTYTSIRINFKKRQFLNSLSHCFVLGHNFASDSHTDAGGNIIAGVHYSIRGETGSESHPFKIATAPVKNGWDKFSLDSETGLDFNQLKITINGVIGETIKLGDISLGWSYSMPHSPDLELTLNYENESIKTQTTKGGHTLTNAGWNHQPVWNRKAAWVRGTGDSDSADFDDYRIYPSGRRSWNLKFSYLDKTNMFSENFLYNESEAYYGIFEKTGEASYNIKQDWLNSFWFSTNCGQLPFIFQPNQSEEEYAICRIQGTPSFTQVANGVYDVSLTVVEQW